MFRLPLIVSSLVLLTASAHAQDSAAGLPRVDSPSGAVSMMLLTRPGASGGLHYIVEFHGKRILDESVLGLKFEGQPPLGPGMKQAGVKPSQSDDTYTIPVGKTSSVRDHYNAIRADFEDDNSRKLTVEIRAYDDGIAFRMIVPDQPAFKHMRLERELTDFRFSKDATTYPLILDGYQSSYEDDYQMRPVSGLHKDWLIGLPLLAQTSPALRGSASLKPTSRTTPACICAKATSASPCVPSLRRASTILPLPLKPTPLSPLPGVCS